MFFTRTLIDIDTCMYLGKILQMYTNMTKGFMHVIKVTTYYTILCFVEVNRKLSVEMYEYMEYSIGQEFPWNSIQKTLKICAKNTVRINNIYTDDIYTISIFDKDKLLLLKM